MNVEISLILQREEEEGTNEKKKINPILLINACSFTSFFFFLFSTKKPVKSCFTYSFPSNTSFFFLVLYIFQSVFFIVSHNYHPLLELKSFHCSC